jgi:uncharacterized membrane protein
MSWRIVYITVMGLVLAGLVHVAIVLLIPHYSTRDAWAFLSGKTDLYSFTRLNPEETGSAISEVDPFFTYGVCRFDLDEVGVKMQGPLTANFWSASVFDDNGTVIYSLNNRTAIANLLDVVIVNPLQSLSLRESQRTDLEASVVIEASMQKGFVIVRVFEPDESWAAGSDEFFKQISCTRYRP